MGWQDELKKAVAPSIRCRDRLRKAAGIFAGLGHLQPLLLATTNSHYLLDRFCMERCCSSEYISRIVTSIIFMEILAIIVVRIAIGIYMGIGKSKNWPIWKDPPDPNAKGDKLVVHTKKEQWYIDFISTVILFLIFLGYIQIFYAFTAGGKKGHMHWFCASLLIQHFLNSLIAGSIGFWEVGLALWYLVTLPMAPIVIFFYQLMIHSWIRNNGPKDAEYIIVEYQIWLVLCLSGIATIFWAAGYFIPYEGAILTNLNTAPSGDNITTQEVTFKVYTATGTPATVTISSTSGTKTVRVYSITLSSGGPVYPDKEVTVKAAADAQTGQSVEAKVTASVVDKTVTIEIKKIVGGRAEPPVWSGKVSGDSASSVTISKITLESVLGSDLTSIEVKEGEADVTASQTTATIKGYTCYPENGYYISGTTSTATSVIEKLWNTAWDGGECYYAEYYKSTGNDPALLKFCILGGTPPVRYYGKDSGTQWKIITSEANFSTNLKNLKTSGTLANIEGGSNATNESTNYNTNFPMAITARKWKLDDLSTWKFTPVKYPLIMQGLSVGAVGSIFPNLIPKTLTCPKTTRTLTVVNMFLVTVPHIFNVMLGDMDLLARIGVGAPWEGDFHTVWSLYIFYILAILFAIFNVHYPEWRLSSFLRNNTWFVFLMILFTDVLNETFNAISRAGICSQKAAVGGKKNHPCLHNKIACPGTGAKGYIGLWTSIGKPEFALGMTRRVTFGYRYNPEKVERKGKKKCEIYFDMKKDRDPYYVIHKFFYENDPNNPNFDYDIDLATKEPCKRNIFAHYKKDNKLRFFWYASGKKKPKGPVNRYINYSLARNEFRFSNLRSFFHILPYVHEHYKDDPRYIYYMNYFLAYHGTKARQKREMRKATGDSTRVEHEERPVFDKERMLEERRNLRSLDVENLLSEYPSDIKVSLGDGKFFMVKRDGFQVHGEYYSKVDKKTRKSPYDIYAPYYRTKNSSKRRRFRERGVPLNPEDRCKTRRERLMKKAANRDPIEINKKYLKRRKSFNTIYSK